MDGWKWTVGCVLCLIAAGCRTDPAIIALERECRMLEDQVYMLEDDLARAESALEACQSTAPSSSRAAAPSSRSRASEGSSLPPLRGPQLSPQNGGSRAPVDPRTLQLPEVEVPSQSLPSGEFPKTLRSTPPATREKPASPAAPSGIRRPAAPDVSPDSLPPPVLKHPAVSRYDSRYPQGQYDPRYQGQYDPRYRSQYDPRYARGQYDPRRYADRDPYGTRPAATRQTRVQPPRLVDPRVVPAQAIALDPRADNSRIDRITLSRALTGGYDRDARSGDAGVAVLVEPRDAHGQLVPAAGPISVVVLDRGLSGSSARVARWDFTAEQTASLYRKTPYGEGFFLEMPWSGNPPAHSHLHLFVRYSTKDGRNVEASREIDVAVPRNGRNWLALTPSAGQPEPARTAGSWQPRQRRDDEPPTQLASVEEPIRVASKREVEEAIRPAAKRDAEPAARRPDAWREKPDESPAEPAGYQAPDEAPQATAAESSAAADPTPAPPAKSTRPVWSPYR